MFGFVLFLAFLMQDNIAVEAAMRAVKTISVDGNFWNSRG
jgi:hypothetical protein